MTLDSLIKDKPEENFFQIDQQLKRDLSIINQINKIEKRFVTCNLKKIETYFCLKNIKIKGLS